jgi:ferric-dicitrate binding protein FerR (iron transport regulator)
MITKIQHKSQKIASLIVLFLNGKITKKQNTELKNWVEASDINRNIFKECTSPTFFDETMLKSYATPAQLDLMWKHINKRTIIKRKKQRLFTSLSAAASIIIILGLSIVLYLTQTSTEIEKFAKFSPGESKATLELADGSKVHLKKDSIFTITSSIGTKIISKGNSLNYKSYEARKEIYNNLKTPKGGEYIITLSDGTKVHLNAESELRHPEVFLEKERKVYLKGEAYFEVSPDENKPFIINVNGIITKVLGTTFNIRAYPEDEMIVTTLVDGKVNIINQKESRILSPGQQSIVKDLYTEINVQEVDTKKFTAWHIGRLIYDNQPLDKILTELSRWYDFDLFYENARAKYIPFSCDLQRFENLSTLLTILEKTHKVKFTVNEKNIVVETI